MKKLISPWNGLDEYKCYGCSPQNAHGLKMEFFEDGDDIISIWKPQDFFQGWVNTLHGGIQCTLMDEIGSWVITRKLQVAGVTSKLNARFIKSISTLEPHITIRARIKDQKRNAIFLDAEIYNSEGELCASSEMLYFTMSKEKSEEEFKFKECKAENE